MCIVLLPPGDNPIAVNKYIKKSLSSPAQIFKKLIIAEQHYVRVAYSRLYPNQTTNAERKNRNFVTPLSKELLPLHPFLPNPY